MSRNIAKCVHTAIIQSKCLTEAFSPMILDSSLNASDHSFSKSSLNLSDRTVGLLLMELNIDSLSCLGDSLERKFGLKLKCVKTFTEIE